MQNRPVLNQNLSSLGSTIFSQMSALAARTQALNLGQGAPDTDGPAEIVDAAVAAMRDGNGNQYPPSAGIPPLREAIAEHQRRFYGVEYDPATEVLVTSGATEAIAATALAMLEPGDEVIAFEPYYDSYTATATMARAKLVPVTLRAPDFRPDLDALADAVTPRTRMLLINTPHNPTGMVLTDAESARIAQIAVDNDLLVMTDEVYEHLVFEGRHRPLASYPGMRDRTITISSAGKTFSFTGWKIGWIVADRALVSAAATAKQYLTFTSGGPLQHGIAHALRMPDSYFDKFRSDLERKRDLFCGGLREAGFDVFVPQGTYFASIDIGDAYGGDGFEYCLSLPERCGVVAVPNAVFYDNEEYGRSHVRFAFCKREEVLTEAVARLKTLM